MLAIPYLIYRNNSGNLETEQSFCPFKMATGLPCPGCGITKSIVYFYDGNVYKSLMHHLFGPFMVVLCVFLLIKFTFELLQNKTLKTISLKNQKKIAFTIAGILIFYHTIRIIYFIATNSAAEILKESIWK